MAHPAAPLAERFWSKVRKTRTCWLWTAARSGFGYGRLMTRKGAFESAHRLSWMMAFGPIPAGRQVLHRCDNPACVRPSHLFTGTQRDNVRDCRSKGRWHYQARNQRGEKNPNAILSDAQVAAMLAELRNGARPVATARKYGIGYKTLWAIRHRKPV